jgi:hypothetical protein
LALVVDSEEGNIVALLIAHAKRVQAAPENLDQLGSGTEAFLEQALAQAVKAVPAVTVAPLITVVESIILTVALAADLQITTRLHRLLRLLL